MYKIIDEIHLLLLKIKYSITCSKFKNNPLNANYTDKMHSFNLIVSLGVFNLGNKKTPLWNK